MYEKHLGVLQPNLSLTIVCDAAVMMEHVLYPVLGEAGYQMSCLPRTCPLPSVWSLEGNVLQNTLVIS